MYLSICFDSTSLISTGNWIENWLVCLLGSFSTFVFQKNVQRYLFLSFQELNCYYSADVNKQYPLRPLDQKSNNRIEMSDPDIVRLVQTLKNIAISLFRREDITLSKKPIQYRLPFTNHWCRTSTAAVK